MDLGSLFLILALAVLVAWYISRPILEPRSWQVHMKTSSREHDRSALLAERDRMLNAIQELDFDYALGKIPEEDYPLQRAQMLQQAAEILRSLDALEQPTASGVDFEKRVEAAIAARRVDIQVAAAHKGGEELQREPTSALKSDDDLEALLAKRRRERQGKAAGFCPKCGKAVKKSDRFCPKCGAKL